MRNEAVHNLAGETARIVDGELVKLFKWMEENGELEKTIIYFYSDHGDHMLYPFIKF